MGAAGVLRGKFDGENIFTQGLGDPDGGCLPGGFTAFDLLAFPQDLERKLHHLEERKQ